MFNTSVEGYGNHKTVTLLICISHILLSGVTRVGVARCGTGN